MNTNVLKNRQRYATRVISAIVACIMFAVTATADIIPVTNTNDSGEGSLRAAIAAANAGDTVSVDLTEGSVISLTSYLSINKNLTILGNGVTLDGGLASQILRTGNINANIYIHRVHFKNGITSSNGGAIFNDARLHLYSCIFSNNRSVGRGGAINNDRLLNVSGCTFFNNISGGVGAAIFNSNYSIYPITSQTFPELWIIGSLFFANADYYGTGSVWDSSNTFSTGGYNVYDKVSGLGSCFNGATDKQISLLPVTTEGCYLTNGSEAAGLITSLPSGYPTEDFYGNPIVAPAAAGAVQQKVLDNYYAVVIVGSTTSYGTINTSIDMMPNPEDGTYPAGANISITAYPTSAYYRGYFLVNGERKKPNNGTPINPIYRFSLTTNVIIRQEYYVEYEVSNTNNDGEGSLRAAIDAINSSQSNSNNIINIASSLSGQTIALTSALPKITKGCTLNGNGVIIDGGGIPVSYTSRILDINCPSSSEVVINRVHFKNGQATNSGGAIRNEINILTLNSCIFNSNTTTPTGAYGGAIYNTGILTANGCTFYNNKTGGNGGAIFSSGTSAMLTLTGNLFYDNTATNGYLIYHTGTFISGGYNIYDKSSNVEFNGEGDKQINALPVLPLTLFLLNGSEAVNVIGSLPENYPATDFYGTSITAPAASGAVQQQVAANMYYLSVTSNTTDYGTVVANPAPDAEELVPAGSVTLTATPATANCRVYWLINGERQESNSETSTAPAYTFNINDNTIVQAVFYKIYEVTTTANTGTGSLREAITAVNSDSYNGVINVSLPAGSVIALTTTLPMVTKSFTLNGNGVIIDGNAISTSTSSRILSINNSFTSINRVHFRNGNISNNALGGAIRNTGGYIYINSCIFTNNQVRGESGQTRNGGAIYNDVGYININSCIFNNNRANNGGAIYNNSGTLTVRGCTFYGNSCQEQGGTIYNSSGSMRLIGNLFYNNTAQPVVNRSSNTVVSEGYNVYDKESWGISFNGVGDRQTNIPTIEPNNFYLYNGSVAAGIITSLPEDYPAIDAYGNPVSVPASAGAVQQQVVGSGYLLSVTSNNSACGTVSSSVTPDAQGFIAANSDVTLTATPASGYQVYWLVNGERHESTSGTSYTFTISTHTEVKAMFYMSCDVTNADDSGEGSLRAAITTVNNSAGEVIINVAPHLMGQTITLSSSLPSITKSFTLNGNGITVDGSGITSGILRISSSVSADIRRVHFKDGRTSIGGAIHNAGTLVLQSCIFSGNKTSSQGGAIYSYGILTVRGCTFYGNNGNSGGAIFSTASGMLALTGNLFFGNKATSGGNVIYIANGAVLSEGYNVYDGTSYNFSFDATLDKQTNAHTVASASFRLLKNSEAADVITSLPENYPAEDFYGSPISTPAAAGAVQEEVSGNGYVLFVSSSNIAHGTVAIDTPHDADGLFSNSVTVTATPATGYGVLQWFVNGKSHKSTGGTDTAPEYTFNITENTTVQAFFCRVFNVTTTDNDGEGSLRAAITALNSSNINTNLINVSLPANNRVITLTSALPSISNDCNINGNGVTIDGSNIPTSGSSRILNISHYATSISIRRVHFKGGKVNGNGGAISNSVGSGNLVLESCIFSGNQSTGTYVASTIYNNGTLTVKGCTFYGNHTESSGTIYNGTGSITLTGNLFFANTASSGNVLENRDGTVTSGGYNVYDGSSSGFSFNGEGDKQTDIQTILPRTFQLLNDSEAAGVITALPERYPDEDFYGNPVVAPAAAGAVQEMITGSYLLSVSSSPAAYGSVTSNVTPDADELIPAGSNVTLTANLTGNSKVAYWLVNGEQKASNGGTATAPIYSFTATTNMTVQAVFYRNYEVTTVADDGAGSLREAMDAIENCLGLGIDTINVSASLAGQTITLISPLPPVHSGSGFTLNGNGIIIDGSTVPSDYTASIMYIDSYINPSISVTIRQVHFKNGSSPYGSAIRNYGGNIELVSCIFSGNQSTGTGGVIHNNNGDITITGCTFYGNSSSDGGAIYCSSGTIILTGNLFHNNTATGDGNTVYSTYSSTVISGGYNVYDNDSYGFNFNSATDTYPDYQVENSIIDLATFAPEQAALVVPAGVTGFPTTDFYGNLRIFPGGAAGAVENMTNIEITVQPAANTAVTESVISGNLSISATTTDEDVTLAYQWYINTVNSNSGGSAISGATSNTFAIPTALTEGTYYYFCEVSDGDNSTSVRSNVATVTVSKAALGGVVTISGTATFGQTLTAVTTGLSSTPTVTLGTLLYQWKRDGVNIGGATSSTYTTVQDDINAAISVEVTTSNTSGSVVSGSTSAVTKASQTAPSAPVAESKTATSVTLNEITGAEYSRDGVNWQDPRTFEGLIPNTSYTFYARMKGDATHEASPPSNASITTEKASLGGAVTITGTATFGQQLTAVTSGLTSTPSVTVGTLSYQWNRDGSPINGATNSVYTLAEGDVGKSITVTVTSENCSGSIVSNATAAVARASQTAPSPPTLASKTDISVTLDAITGAEYSRDGVTWQPSPTFNGLAPEMSYTFYARLKETGTHTASPASTGLTVVTDATPVYRISLAPADNYTFVAATYGYSAQTAHSITVNNTGNQPIGALSIVLSGAGNGSFTLSATTVADIAVNGNATFTVVPNTGLAVGTYAATVTVSGGNNISASFGVNFTVNRAAQTIPAPPTVAITTATSVTLTAIAGAEYRVNNGEWQDSPTFTGLMPETSYTFYARLKETGTHTASPASEGVSASTSATPAYGISLAPAGNFTFTATTYGYGAQTAYRVTVNNTGNQPAGALSIALSGAGSSSFTLSTTTVADIAVNGNATFTVAPNTGLAVGTYTATVTVSGGNSISASFGVNFTVNKVTQAAPATPVIASTTATSVTLNVIAGAEYRNGTTGAWQDSPTFTGLTPETSYTFYARMKGSDTHETSAASAGVTIPTSAAPAYGISLSPAGDYTFAAATYGYGVQTAHSVTVNNVGNQATGALNIALSGANSNRFTLSTTSINSLTVAGSGSFSVVPYTGLEPGTYTATVTVSGGNGISAAFGVSFTVSPAGQSAPSAPTLANVTPTSITLNVIPGAEYRNGNGEWQSDPVFNGLTPETSYTFYARIKGDDVREASPLSAGFTVSTGAQPVYGISLDPAGNRTFAVTTYGYAAPTAHSVAIVNTGNQPAGALTISLNGESRGSFVLSRTSVEILSASGSEVFTVAPASGLSPGVYLATITIVGANSVSATFDLSFTVNKAMQTAPAAPVLNSRTATGVSLKTIAGAQYRNGVGEWQDSPVFNGLTPETEYTFYARLKGNDTHEASAASAGLTVATGVAPAYGISLNPAGNYVFATDTCGYLAQPPYILTVSNVGNQPTGALQISLSGDDANDFTVSTESINNIAPAGSETFSLVPKRGLKAGTYVATLTVGGDNDISVSVEISFTVDRASQTAPAAPTVANKTATSVTLIATAGAEYRIGGGEWQSVPTFDNLSAYTAYTFYARKAETDTHYASPSSDGAPATTYDTEAELLNLSVNGDTLGVAPAMEYMAKCDEQSATLNIASNATASLIVSVNGKQLDDWTDIRIEGDMMFTIQVVSEDGENKKTYGLALYGGLDAQKVLVQRWDDVLAVNSNPDNNGNHTNIDSVRWYRNNEEHPFNTAWYIKLNDIVENYHAEISLGGKWHNVCGSPKVRPLEKVIAYPNPVSVGDNLNLHLPTDFAGGYINVITLSGATVKHKLPLPNINNVINVMDWSPGVYLLNIVSPTGDVETVKIIVN